MQPDSMRGRMAAAAPTEIFPPVTDATPPDGIRWAGLPPRTQPEFDLEELIRSLERPRLAPHWLLQVVALTGCAAAIVTAATILFIDALIWGSVIHP